MVYNWSKKAKVFLRELDPGLKDTLANVRDYPNFLQAIKSFVLSAFKNFLHSEFDENDFSSPEPHHTSPEENFIIDMNVLGE